MTYNVVYGKRYTTLYKSLEKNKIIYGIHNLNLHDLTITNICTIQNLGTVPITYTENKVIWPD